MNGFIYIHHVHNYIYIHVIYICICTNNIEEKLQVTINDKFIRTKGKKFEDKCRAHDSNYSDLPLHSLCIRQIIIRALEMYIIIIHK